MNLGKMKLLLGVMIVLALTLRHALSTVPDYIACNKPEHEGTVVVLNESYWMQCVRGKLIQQGCVFDGNNSLYSCVPNKDIVTFLKQRTAGAEFYTDSSLTFANCYHINYKNIKYVHQMKALPAKHDCAMGLETGANWPQNENYLCHLKKKVYFMNEHSFFECSEEKDFVLRKCVIQRFSKNMCLSLIQIDKHARNNRFWDEMENRMKIRNNFCHNISLYIDVLYPAYEFDWRPCNEPSKTENLVPSGYSVTRRRTLPSFVWENKKAATNVIVPKSQPPTDLIHKIPLIHMPVPTPAPLPSPVESRDLRGRQVQGSSVYIPFNGANRMRPFLRNCKEPAHIANGIVSKCNIPYMCQTEKGQCLSFFDVEYMFGTYQQSTKSFPSGAWDEHAFNSIPEWFEYQDEYEMYLGLKNSVHGNPNLFNTLAEIAELQVGDENKIVTIDIENTKTDVSPKNVCYITTKLAPFQESYKNKRLRSCPRV